jgi:hypothetical protein
MTELQRIASKHEENQLYIFIQPITPDIENGITIVNTIPTTPSTPGIPYRDFPVARSVFATVENSQATKEHSDATNVEIISSSDVLDNNLPSYVSSIADGGMIRSI